MPGCDDVKIEIHNRCSDFAGFRAASIKSLFNAESGCNLDLEADLPIDDEGWKLGLIVGPSGSGKSSIGRKLFGEAAVYSAGGWPDDAPIIDAIGAGLPINDATAALSAVGLGSVPAWLRPYRVLSNGERFRADLARILCDSPAEIVIDEFSSVVDRQIARIGALAFGKAWKRGAGKCVLLSCHYDIIDWLEPDWVFDTATGKYAGRGLWRRPRFELELWETNWSLWPMFEPHHYLKLPRMIGAQCYIGTVDGEPVVTLGVATRPGLREARACRMVVMPEWQGAGVGMRFLNVICQMWLDGKNRFRKPMQTLFHTSHPGLCAALRRDRKWSQISAALFGVNKTNSGRSIRASGCVSAGYGGHFRAVQGFRYYGETA